MLNAEELKKFAKEVGVDLSGVADIGRFESVSPEHNPKSIFPETKSIIVIGNRITRGTLRGVEEGTQFDIYSLYGRDWLNNRILAMATFRVAEFLEDNGWEAVPLPNLPPEIPSLGIPVRANQPPPNVMINFDDAAVRAGLGEIGYCGIFLTPQFGPRQRFQIILTSLELKPDPILQDKVCDYSDGHWKNFCPLKAISSENEKIINICGKKMKIANIDYEKCKICKNGTYVNPYHLSGKPDRLAAICIRSCIQHLEEKKRIKSIFRNPFRKRAPWKIIVEEKRFSGE